MKLNDKVAVITGSARGIGRAIAEAMARKGARVVITDRDGAEADATARAIGDAATAIKADASSPTEIQALFEGAVARFGGSTSWSTTLASAPRVSSSTSSSRNGSA
ncbi:MAG TPA: SDR family NAD(P)-dependent oxidoreductase [Lichenihabitans sp.]|jgi:NAD(P)-dependent dehydrogenase (short-subunit alcohol dehydrogenase family)|nr:SDR family NAD(P)-dependent oxidoreductase [Lichenihabitans sp.]